MAYVAWVDRCIFNAASAGLGDFVVSSAVTGYLTPAQANASDQYKYRYAAQTLDGSGNINDWEVGTGTYTVSSTILARTTVEFSSNANAKVNFATAPQVMITALTGDFTSQLDNDTNFYVATTGSDTTGNGTSAHPWATLQKAYNTIIHYDLNGYAANINIANGTYAGVNLQLGNGSGTINFIGASAAGVIINPLFASAVWGCFQVGASTFVNLSIGIQDLTCSGTGIEAGIIVSGAGSVVTFYGDIFFTNLGKDIWAIEDSSVYLSTNSITITGNTNIPFHIEDASSLVNFSNAMTIVGTPAWTTAFVVADDGSLFETENHVITFTGTATGKRFLVKNGSVINTGTNNLNYFPGNVVGDILAGGQYDSYGVRDILIADRTYYVTTTGNDTTGDGSVGTPWLTLQHATDVISETLDFAGFTVNVSIGAGSFAGFGVFGTVGGGTLQYTGAGPANTTITNGAFGNAGGSVTLFGATAQVWVDEVTITTDPAVCWSPIYLSAIGTLGLGNRISFTGNLAFASVGGTVQTIIFSDHPGLVLPVANISVSGTWNHGFWMAYQGLLEDYAAWTFVGTPSFVSYAYVSDGTYDLGAAASYTGAATGKRFQIENGGIIATYGAGINFFPGDAAGTGTSGSYDDLIFGVLEAEAAINVQWHGWMPDGTDHSTEALAILALVTANGGGTLFFPPGIYRADSQLLIPAFAPLTGTINAMANIRMTGAGGGGNPNGNLYFSPENAATLDLRYTGTEGKIESRGAGTLYINDLGFIDGGASNATPFIHITNTTLVIRDCTFIGSGNVGQDAIVLGSTGATSGNATTDVFSGYGTMVNSCTFFKLNRGVYMLNYCNNVQVQNCQWWGSVGDRAIETKGQGSIGNSGLVISNNLIEMKSPMAYGIVIEKTFHSVFHNNSFYDSAGNGNFVCNYFFSGGSGDAGNNTFILGYNTTNSAVFGGDLQSVRYSTVIGGGYFNQEISGNGTASNLLGGKTVIRGAYDSGDTWPGQLTIVHQASDNDYLKLSVDFTNNLSKIDSNVPLQINPGGQATSIWANGGMITGGFLVTPGNGGTVSSGTFTPAAANGNYQFYTNGGAHAFDVPAADSAIDVLVTNNASAGAITFSGSYAGGTHGDSLTTTNLDKFIISVRRINSVSAYIIKALQ